MCCVLAAVPCAEWPGGGPMHKLAASGKWKRARSAATQGHAASRCCHTVYNCGCLDCCLGLAAARASLDSQLVPTPPRSRADKSTRVRTEPVTHWAQLQPRRAGQAGV
eukprot:scaffold7215_cov366-Prasinococcus_capsulatus_cf.AAC.6